MRLVCELNENRRQYAVGRLVSNVRLLSVDRLLLSAYCILSLCSTLRNS